MVGVVYFYHSTFKSLFTNYECMTIKVKDIKAAKIIVEYLKNSRLFRIFYWNKVNNSLQDATLYSYNSIYPENDLVIMKRSVLKLVYNNAEANSYALGMFSRVKVEPKEIIFDTFDINDDWMRTAHMLRSLILTNMMSE